MTNWRVSGVVEDSEGEDDFDSQEQNASVPAAVTALPEQSEHPPTSTKTAHATKLSIWDFPDSSPDPAAASPSAPLRPSTPTQTARPAAHPDSSPLSSLPDDDELWASQFDYRHRTPSSPVSRLAAHVARDASPDPLEFNPDDGEASNVEPTEPPPGSSIVEQGTETVSLLGSPGLQSTQNLDSRDINGNATPEAMVLESLSNTTWRYERSFRPRKPIQEHPYLLESAQYSSVLKSHGVRPIRMAQQEAEVQRSRKPPEEDSQDKEFVGSSQSTVIGGQGASGEDSQPFDDDLVVQDELLPDFAPSSSDPRLNTPRRRGVTSSPRSPARDTDVTSPLDVSHDRDDDDLPSIDDLVRGAKTIGSKRSYSDEAPISRKRRKHAPQTNDNNIESAKRRFEPPPPLEEPPTTPSRPPRTGSNSRQKTHEQTGNQGAMVIELPARTASPELQEHAISLEVEDRRVSLSGGDAPSQEDDSESDGNSSTGSQIKTYGRRARGVLPASHFRLDAPANRSKPRQGVQARQSDLDAAPKRGVAVRRVANAASQPGHAFPFVESEESDEEVAGKAKAASQRQHVQTLINIEEDDDDVSVIEDNTVDHMVQAPPRRSLDRTISRGSISSRKSAQGPLRPEKKRQEKITGHFAGTTKLGLAQGKSRPPRPVSRKKTTKRGGTKQQQRRRSKPQADVADIGVLDVIQPDAPPFMKIAARTARANSQRGRSSPTKKSISLHSRRDQVDAGRILQDWKQGKLRQRPSVQNTAQSSRTGSSTPRPPLAQISPNAPPRLSLSASGTGASTRMVSTSTTGHRQSEQAPSRSVPLQVKSKQQQTRDSGARPAQFEEDLVLQSGRQAFHKQKRLLDNLYRRTSRRQTPSIASDVTSMELDTFAIPEPEAAQERPDQPTSTSHRHRRPRKSAKPSRIDTTAAQYTHANDPLPAGPSSPTASESIIPGSNLLRGLGPFGSQYSQHFEVFSLPRGVFFHEETLLGSGRVRASLNEDFVAKIRQPRPRVFFSLDGQPLRWGVWNDEVSSDLGILVDRIGSELLTPDAALDQEFSAKNAAQFVRSYIQDALNVSDDTEARSFIVRLKDVLRGFLTRLEAETHSCPPRRQKRILEVLLEFLVTAICGITLCRHQTALSTETWDMEDVFKRTARLCASCLTSIGLEDLTALYEDVQSLRSRERGVHADNVVPQAWVILMTTLDDLRIPRLSFWDVTYSVLLAPGSGIGDDVHDFERLWRVLFNLLPLGEFNGSGVIVPGSRHQASTAGWALPQAIIKQVFELYKANGHQGPSFNNYARALVSRCHYLVEQWGWQKSNGIIGVIFDFFASRGLSHLRNEEAYQSPRFLEQLHFNPSLQVEPSDKCFHIFLKLVAITIRRSALSGSDKDIKNLVFRILPNHERQYLKEQNIHQHDLAALRNHHDLLCTLFWAAPPHIRPQISQLEKLVIPVSSHREACLINLRAWGQLARFAASQEIYDNFVPFYKWQTNTFRQLLDQYNSVDADIQQQFQDLSKNNSHAITHDMRNAVIASNKAATMDAMRFSLTISLDAAKHSKNLDMAILAGNVVQVKQVLDHFSTPTLEYPWAILHDALAIVELFLGQVEEALDRQDRQDQAAQVGLEDSIMQIDRNVTANLFSTARRMIRQDVKAGESMMAASARAECVEHSVVVAGKMAALLTRCKAMRLSQCFRPGEHCLFDNVPSKLDLRQRRYLPLFLAIVHRQQAVDLSDIGLSNLQLWLLSLVKPRRFLAFECHFAAALLHRSTPFVPASAGATTMPMSHDANRGHFEYALLWMRRCLQEASSSESRALASEFSVALRAAMDQIETDLRARMLNDTEHAEYVGFVRRLISLVKSLGAGICTVTPFFYQVTKDYSPPTEDPQLQVAQIQSYGIRLAEGDPRIVPQLFHYLYHNFKQALVHGKLGEEMVMLHKGMKNDAILAFSLGKMLPAILRASIQHKEMYVIMDVFCEAITLRLAKSLIPHQVAPEPLGDVLPFIRAILNWADEMRTLGPAARTDYLYIFARAMALLNALQPALEAASFGPHPPRNWDEIQEGLADLARVTQAANALIWEEQSFSRSPFGPEDFFAGCEHAVARPRPREQEGVILSLANDIVADVDKNWIITDGFIDIQAPGRTQTSSSTPARPGLRKAEWDKAELYRCLRSQLEHWNRWWWVKCQGRLRPISPSIVDGPDEPLLP